MRGKELIRIGGSVARRIRKPTGFGVLKRSASVALSILSLQQPKCQLSSVSLLLTCLIDKDRRCWRISGDKLISQKGKLTVLHPTGIGALAPTEYLCELMDDAPRRIDFTKRSHIRVNHTNNLPLLKKKAGKGHSVNQIALFDPREA